MDQATEKKNVMELVGDDAKFMANFRRLGKGLHREVFRCLTIICELDVALEYLGADEQKLFNEMRENWARWYAKDLQPEEPKTLVESRACAAEDVTKQVEKILSDYLPDCQGEIIEKLTARLPKRLADDELAGLRDSAACAVGDGVVNSGLPLRTQITLFKQLKTTAEKTVRGLNGKRK